jgi:arylsulfatase A-like enzyme
LVPARTAQDQGLPATGRTLPQLLKNNGYRTGLVGKWHLGYKPEFSPNAHGFDYFFGFKSGLIDYYQHTDSSGDHDLFENTQPTQVTGYSTDIFTERSIKFIEDNAKQPFFLEVAFNAAHWPFQFPIIRRWRRTTRASSSRRMIRRARGAITSPLSSAPTRASARSSRRSSAWGSHATRS